MSVQYRIEEGLKKRGHLLFVLLDAEEIADLDTLVKQIEYCDIDAFLVGGSTISDQLTLHNVVRRIKEISKMPVILFPGNITGISQSADAILFSSLLNSDDPYFLIGAQALAAPLVRKYNLEVIPMGYIIIGKGQSAGFIGRARNFPPDKPELVTAYALAGYYLGMRFIYLEAGSGSKEHVPYEVVGHVRSAYPGRIIVGGGIRSPDVASKLCKRGADILVVGNLVYEKDFDTKLKKISKAIHTDSQ